MTFQPHEHQRSFIEASAEHGSAVLAVGAPGTGKTAALVEAVARRVEAGTPLDHLVVLTWSRPAAQRLRARIITRLGTSQLAPVITTVPGWCLALQRRFGQDADAGTDGLGSHVLTGPEQQMQVRELVDQLGAQFWPASVRPAIATMAFSQELRTGLARTRQWGMDPEDLTDLGERLDRPEWVAMGRFFETYLDVLDAQQAWDYAELVHRTRLLLLDRHVAGVLPEDVEGIFCDEFAELDPAQIALLVQARQMGIPVALTADPQTRVFSFRGADPRAVPDFTERFAAEGLPAPTTIVLADSLRSHGTLRRALSRLMRRNPWPLAGTRPLVPEGNDLPDDEHSSEDGHLSAGDGDRSEAVCRSYESAAAEITGVADDLLSARLRGVAWSDQAVICRAGRGQLDAIARGLADRGIPVEVASGDMALAEQAPVITLIDALTLALQVSRDQPPSDEQLTRLLISPLTQLDPTAVRRVGRALWLAAPSGAQLDPSALIRRFLLRRVNTHLTTPQILNRVSDDEGSGSACDVDIDPDGLLEDGDDPGVAAVLALGDLVGDAAARITRGEGAYDILWQLWDGTGWPDRLRREALSGSPSASSADRDLNAVVALFDVASRHMELTGARGAETLIAEVSGQEIPGDQARESDPRGRGVQLLTAHRAKGLQWSRVVVMGAVEGQWPGTRRGDGLLAVDRLDMRAPGQPPAPSAWIQEERRAFALATSRAIDELVITAAVGSGDDHIAYSRFVTEMGIPVEEIARTHRRARTMVGLVAELRAVTMDPESSVALRQAAADQLGMIATVRDGQGRALMPGADPQRWWSVGGWSGTAEESPDDAQSGRNARLTGSEASRDGASGIRPAADETIRLSVTGLERLVTCPRQWFLDVTARASASKGFSAGVGSVIHLLAEHAVTDQLDQLALMSGLDEAWRDLDLPRPQWQRDAEHADAEHMIRRFVTWQDHDPGEVLGVEVPVRHIIHAQGFTVELRGSIDRLERDPVSGRVWIVDFKTGRRAPRKTDAATNLQLGAYQLAVSQGSCASLTGQRPAMGGAMLVYLRVPSGVRDPELPAVLPQKSLDDHPYPEQEPSADSWLTRVERRGPTMVHDALAFAATCMTHSNYPAVQGTACRYCGHRADCPVWRREGNR